MRHTDDSFDYNMNKTSTNIDFQWKYGEKDCAIRLTFIRNFFK